MEKGIFFKRLEFCLQRFCNSEPTGLMMDEKKKRHKVVDLETDGAFAAPNDEKHHKHLHRGSLCLQKLDDNNIWPLSKMRVWRSYIIMTSSKIPSFDDR